MSQARVQVIHETLSGNTSDWHLCFQWCRYVHDDGLIEFGYRFIWRRPDGSLQPARGQARIPSLGDAHTLMDQALKEGWGHYDGEKLGKEFQAATVRLQDQGCVVTPESGYVGWADRDTAQAAQLTPQMIADERLVREGKS